ncbi:MAG TPA: tetratricopeptide repeat protein [Bacteroidota bacterium]|nr:tetratricopeptide repeat protein [Bacteroidota bacterium]
MSQDNEEPAAKAQRLRTEAGEKLAQHDALPAEQLLSQVIPLDRKLQQWDRLAEDQAAIAKVQVSLGLFTSALENYEAAWNRYRQTGDHAAEVRVMNGIGNFYVGMGEFERGASILKEALDLSRIANNDEPDGETAMSLGDAYERAGEHDDALNAYASALAVFNKRRYSPAIVRAQSRIGLAYAELGRRDEALGTYSTIETVLASVENVLVKAEFDYNKGRMLRMLGDWTGAAAAYRDGIGMLEGLPGRDRNDQTNDALIRLYTALGRAYAHSFAFGLARQNYIEAYTRAKDAGAKIPIGYLLVAIADCERKLSLVNPAQENGIEANTLYEQAITLFSRIGCVSGEALADERLGALKEDQGDTEAALSLYRRSFELCAGGVGEFKRWEEDEEFLRLREDPTPGVLSFADDTFWYEPLVAALAREGRAEEALFDYEEGKAASIARELRSFPLSFRERDESASVGPIVTKFGEERIDEAALSFQKGLNTDQKDVQLISTEERDLTNLKEELRGEATSLSQKYGPLEMLFRAPALSETELRAALPYGAVVLDYLLSEDRIIIFVVSFDGMGRQVPINVVEVPAYKDIVLGKVRQFELMLRERIHTMGSGYVQTTDIERISEELYNYFLRPVERLFTQRVIIVPPKELEDFPFHALTRSTSEGLKPMIEIADVSYLPYLGAIKSLQPSPRSVGTVVAVGNPRGNDWPLDFELRDIRSFFRGATVSVSQNANERQLFGSEGDVLQLSTDFVTDTVFPGRSAFVLSNGSITNPDALVPVGNFLRLPDYPVVYLSDERRDESGLRPFHAALLLMNGASDVILAMRPTEPKAAKFFSEKFYSGLAKGSGVSDAYRAAVVAMSTTPAFAPPYEWSQIFRFGK